MEIEKIIEYLLIGNLRSQAIIYEMQNTNDINIVNEVKLLFAIYLDKKITKEESTKVESFYINISSEKIIMIAKTNISFTLEQNTELFERINKYALDPKSSRLKMWRRKKLSLSAKITNLIYDYFQYINANKQVISEAYFKIGPKIQNYASKKDRIDSNRINFKNNNNSLVSMDNTRSIDVDKSSMRQIINGSINNNSNNININNVNISDDKTEDENIKVNYPNNNIYNNNRNKNKGNNLILNDNKELDNTNISKSSNKYEIVLNKNSNNSPKKAPPKEKREISWKRVIIIFILVLVVLIIIGSIYLIIINSYSYR